MVILMSAMAERYMEANKGARVSVTGGGTRSGVAAMINRTADIIAASRDMTEAELKLAISRGVRLESEVIGTDGIAIIVNRSNPIDLARMEDLQGIFTGAFRSWRELGGDDTPLLVYSREASSGTFRYMQETVLKKSDFRSDSRFLPSNASIIEGVSSDRSAIGYVSFGHALHNDRIKMLPVGNETGGSVVPDKTTIGSGDYPIARPLRLYLDKGGSKEARDFVRFCLSAEGQNLVESYGYARVTREKSEVASR